MLTEELLKILQNIEKRLDNIEQILESINKSCKKMDEHIVFIDNVYNNIRKPFTQVLSYYHGDKVDLDKKAIKDDK
jgi:uncharacterized protein YaaN involved in tellurite resistance